MRTAIFFAISLLSVGLVEAKKKVATYDYDYFYEYKEICRQAATDDNVFQTFKRHSHYMSILEHLTQGYGQEYLNIINSRYPHLLQQFKKFQENDLLGSPIVYDYPIIGKTGPTTLRYVKVLGDLEAYIGNLDHRKIIEIGAGYGGQCLIISKAYHFDEYCIVDLNEAEMLIEKYLNLHKVENFKCLNRDEIPTQDKYDLVISNYAFSEFIRPVQQLYLERIIKNARHGYLTVNYLTDAAKAGRHTLEELIGHLRFFGYNPQILPEEPLTARDNCIIVW